MLRPPCENPPVGEFAVQYAPGQQLAGTVYRVVRHLATGGMGSVYDVEDITVGKRYVLKTLHPELVTRDDLAKRMREEARTLAKLQHPNIVDVVTAGLTTDETRMPFYVMERLNGQNLRVVLEKKGALELAHAYRIAIDVLDALEHAHEHAVIHRDVKPDNVFLHRNANGTNLTKLLDFGIMRLLDRKMSHTHGKFIGTLRYASPEQIYGGELGPGTDIYSLGVVLYEMIAGRGPFDDVGDVLAIGAAHVQQPPPPVSRFAPSVPPALERLVMSALAKTPQERPRDCFSFASDLRRMLHEEQAVPRSATAVAVLSLAASNTVERAPLTGPTDLGMAQPSSHASRGGALPPTVRLTPAAEGDVGGGAAAMVAPTQSAVSPDMAVAATLASAPGGEAGRAVVVAAMAAVAASDARDAREPRLSGAPPAIDRSAETRAAAAGGATQRLSSPNGTAVDLQGFPFDSGDALRAALAQREPVEVPPAIGQPEARHDLVFPRTPPYVGETGPLSGEAQTRPPERGIALPLLGAAAFGALMLMVGAAILAVTKPWARASVSHSPPAAVSEIASGATAFTGVIGGASQTAQSSAAALPSANASASANPPAAQIAPASATARTAVAQGTPAPGHTGNRPATPGAPATPSPPVAIASTAARPSPASAKKPTKGPGPAAPPRPEDVGFE